MPKIFPVETIIPGFDTEGMEPLWQRLLRTRFHLRKHPRSDNGMGVYAGVVLDLIRRYSTEEDVRLAVNRTLKDQVVVDLGAGKHPYGYWLACQAGAEAYVGNEHFFTYNLNKCMRSQRWLEGQVGEHVGLEDIFTDGSNNIPAAVTGLDMVEMIERLPQHSVSILLSGIDGTILPLDRGERLVESIHLAVHPAGGLVAYDVLDEFIGNDLTLMDRFPNEHPYARMVSGCFRATTQ